MDLFDSYYKKFDITDIYSKDVIMIEENNLDIYSGTLEFTKKIILENVKFVPTFNSKQSGNNAIVFIIKSNDKTNWLLFSIQQFYKVGNKKYLIIFCYDIEKNELTRHQYYTSPSEFDFWRYDTDNSIKDFSKTLINLKIQQYINDSYDSFHEYNKKEKYKFINPTDIYKKRIETDDNKNIFFHDEEAFFVMTNYYLNNQTIYEKFKRYDLMFNLQMMRVNFKEKPYINECNIQNMFEILKYHKEINDEITNRWDTYFKVKNTEDFLYDINKMLREKFLEIFELSSIKCLYTFSNKAIYQKKIINKKTNKEYFLYYVYFKKGYKYYQTIFQILPLNNEILPLGIENKYVASGIFINKPYLDSGEFIGEYNSDFLEFKFDNVTKTLYPDFSLFDLLETNKIDKILSGDLNSRLSTIEKKYLLLLDNNAKYIYLKKTESKSSSETYEILTGKPTDNLDEIFRNNLISHIPTKIKNRVSLYDTIVEDSYSSIKREYNIQIEIIILEDNEEIQKIHNISILENDISSMLLFYPLNKLHLINFRILNGRSKMSSDLKQISSDGKIISYLNSILKILMNKLIS